MLIRREEEGMDSMDMLYNVIIQDKEATIMTPDIKRFVKNFKDRFNVDLKFDLSSSVRELSRLKTIINEKGQKVKIFPYKVYPIENEESSTKNQTNS